MKALILGSKGQLGHALTKTAPNGTTVTGLHRPDLDITDLDQLRSQCVSEKPAVIVNAAAYTSVDLAESQATAAEAVNVDGARNIAIISRELDARLIHVSTDFVFDGNSSVPYTAAADTRPLNVYGQTKRDGERAVLKETDGTGIIVRTSWLYSATGHNFVNTMLRLMREKDDLAVVSDQVGSPTWADSLAEAIWQIAGTPGLHGIYHWSDQGQVSWYEFALAIQEEAVSLGILSNAIPIRPIRSAEYKSTAVRPAFSVLDCTATQQALAIQPATWRENLRRMLAAVETTTASRQVRARPRARK